MILKVSIKVQKVYNGIYIWARASVGTEFVCVRTSPFSRGTILEYSVVQMISSSWLIRSIDLWPNRSIQSLLEAGAKTKTVNKSVEKA